MGNEDLIPVRKIFGVLTGLVIFISCIVLTGWMFNIVLFKSILPSFSPMNPLTALLFLLSGIALLLLYAPNSLLKIRLGKSLALCILFAAVTKLIGNVTEFNLEIDKILFVNKLAGNRMVINSALNFTLIGLSLFFIDRRKSILVPSQAFASIAFLISFFTIISYVYAPSTLQKEALQISMPIHSACSFLLLTISIGLAQSQLGFMRVIMHRNIGGAIFRKLLSISVVLPFLVVVLRYSQGDADLSATEFGTPIIVICIIAISFFLIWAIAQQLNKADEKRKQNYSELIQLKNDLADSEIKYRNLVDNAGVMMYTFSLNGTITFASYKTHEVTGYTPAEFIGMHYSQFIHRDYIADLKNSHRLQVMNSTQESSMEFRFITKAGKIKWIEQTAVLLFENGVPSGFQCIAKDISETREMQEILKNFEEQLVINQERLQSILDNASSLIYIKDLEGKYVLTNKKFKAFYDIEDHVLLGETDFNFSDHVQAQRFKDTDSKVLTTGKPVEVEEIIETQLGKFHMLIAKFPLVDAHGKIYGISGIATDITERAKDREKIIQARQLAEDARKMQEQFLANMSHEIRTPMNGILGMTSLLLETDLNEEQADFTKTIKKSSDNLIVVINDILDYSKITAGKLRIETIDFNPFEVLENIKAVFRHRLQDKGLTLQANISHDVPTIVNGDPYRLNQILLNLVGNAIKFTGKGGITIDISVVNNLAGKILLQFTITDTGIGIHADKLKDIFESFTQGSIETSRKYGGTGLGLAITKQLLELQGGSVTVQSKIDCGTTFKFSIPYGASTSNKAVFFAGDDLKSYNNIFKGKKFLVAEDNEINQKVILQVLQKVGGIVHIANNGLEAIALLKENSDYHLIIMDLQMPEMDGYAATKYIRNVMQLSTPIVAMTASAMIGEKSKCIEMGMNDYLAKPFNFAYIYKRLSMLLDETAENIQVLTDTEKSNTDLFDLSILEEMDDDEYLEDILGIFLENTPIELQTLQDAIITLETDRVYAIAHKLKSSVGLIQANSLLHILTEIERAAKAGETKGISSLVQSACNAYKEIEFPLKSRLKDIGENIKLSI